MLLWGQKLTLPEVRLPQELENGKFASRRTEIPILSHRWDLSIHQTLGKKNAEQQGTDIVNSSKESKKSLPGIQEDSLKSVVSLYLVTTVFHFALPNELMNCIEHSGFRGNISPGEAQVGRCPTTQSFTLSTKSPLLPFPNLGFSFYSLLFLSSAPYNQLKRGKGSCWPHIWAGKGLCQGESVPAPQCKVRPCGHWCPLFGTRLTSNFLFPFHRAPQADGAPNLPAVSQKLKHQPVTPQLCTCFRVCIAHYQTDCRFQLEEQGCTWCPIYIE